MAGAGYKLYSTGDVLSASDVNTYLQQQTVMVFASAAARTTALASVLAEGMVTYLKDTDVVEIYTGAAWVSLDDPNAIQNSIVDAKGDLISATADNTPARLAVGNNGETLVADSSATTGLRWQGNYSAGKNAILNGDMNIWQRGTSYAVANGGPFYGAADRWRYYHNGSTAGTNTVSRQTFTVGQTDVPNNPTYYQRWTATTIGTSQTVTDFDQLIENVGTFAGMATTGSIYIKASGTFTYTIYLEQNFGSGGSASVGTQIATGSTTTGWVRVIGTATLPSISGKTVGTGSSLRYLIRFSNPTNGATFDIANAQVEASSTVTAFQTATGTLQGELAACQRYYESINTISSRNMLSAGYCQTTSVARFTAPVVQKRTTPTVTITGTLNVMYSTGSEATLSSISELDSNSAGNLLTFRYNASGTPFTSGQAVALYASGGAVTFGISAEL